MLFVVKSYHPLAVKYTAYAKKSLFFMVTKEKKTQKTEIVGVDGQVVEVGSWGNS